MLGFRTDHAAAHHVLEHLVARLIEGRRGGGHWAAAILLSAHLVRFKVRMEGPYVYTT
jgi:hypothetical protein